VQPIPFSTPASFGTNGAYSVQASPNLSAVQSPVISSTNLPGVTDSPLPTPALQSPSVGSLSSQSSLPPRGPVPTSAPREEGAEAAAPSPSLRPRSLRSLKERAQSSADSQQPKSKPKPKPKPKQKSNRWWRISDDKIKESKTSEVLGMQKDVYMLFYELDRH
jgi:ubiquitin carboxyl-terminal hydrolase 16